MTTVSKKSVTFSSNVTGIQIMNIDDYTPREISASWYNQEDMDRITNRCFKVLTRMESGASNNKGKKCCMRGLEGHTTTGAISKNKNRASAYAAVLMEQSKQWMRNEVDEQAIADAYRSTTSSCQLWAQVVGKHDEHTAEYIYYMEEEDGLNETTNVTFSHKSKNCNALSVEERIMDQVERPIRFQQQAPLAIAA
ncbi:unnamed protein product [Cylindrotheca closterium]|uniref:Uncharacterized protein n=1 Tax=Cylindrotheca closterium TaxID=2856 RepID=A0AAD2PX78_9STRA|nr:unnamed protein product [Cylindrotheca closterium]